MNLVTTHLFQNRTNPQLTVFDALRAVEEFRHDYPEAAVTTEPVLVEFDEPMSFHAKELYIDLMTANAEKSLPLFMEHLSTFIDEGV